MEEGKRPFLSVVTINYNDAAGLESTIKSVLKQKVPRSSLEYIVIDGGSTDGSKQVIERYAKDIDYWVSEKDEGIYNAMNKGIRQAHGRYIAILNSGDYYTDDALVGLEDLAKEHPGEILYGATDCMLNGEFLYSYSLKTKDLMKNMATPHDTCFVPAEIYQKYGLYDESFKSSADWDLFLTFYQAGVKFYHFPKIISLFDMNGISAMHIEDIREPENLRIRKKHGLYKERVVAKPNPLKKAVKCLLPYGAVRLVQIIKKRRDKRRRIRSQHKQ